MSTPLEQIESGLERAERRINALGIVLAVAVAGLAYLVYHPSDTLQVAALEVVDVSGNTVAFLGQREGRSGLFLLDDKSVPRVSVFHADDADGLFIDDGQGITRIGVAQFAHGGGGVALHGPGSNGGAVLYYKGRGSLRFYDADGKVVKEIAEPQPE